jgi:hypothetical protein
MKTLINTTTGQIITIDKVLRSEESLKYTLYDNGIDLKNGKKYSEAILPLDMTATPPTPMNLADYMDYVSVIAVQLVYPTFVESEDTINWCIPVGSTLLPTTLRVLVPFFTIGKRIYTGEPIDILLQAMSYLTTWTSRGNSSVVQYLEELLPEHQAILEAYASDGIVIEYKV